MASPSLRLPKVLAVLLLAISIGAVGRQGSGFQRTNPGQVRLQGHMPTEAVLAARWMGRLAPESSVSMAIALPLRNQAELQDLLSRLYDPSDPLCGNYLTTEEFTDRFSPTQEDYDLVTAYARNLGFTVTGTHPNRLLLDVSGPAQVVEGAFNLRMQRYVAWDGREFRAPDNDPEVPEYIAARIVGVIGLDNAAVWHAHNRFSLAQEASLVPLQIGTGPGGALTPSDISKAYNVNNAATSGSGQTLGLFELDGYTASDVATYESYFSLKPVPLQNIPVDGFSGMAGSGASEVTLDIELMAALAQGASKILVYEGPNTSTGVLDTYNKIATDNVAKQISTSWGLSETQSSAAGIASENAIFQQMAVQGQSIYAAAGDSGAYDNGSTLSVDDPASQPFVVGAGGTQLFVNTVGTYNYETTWNNGRTRLGAGGGGVSAIWGIPPYQQGILSAASSTMRNVPDVSLNADQYTGYSIFYKGSWYIFGGTSCAAPLWAAFTAQVNQQRSIPLGFANYAIYKIAGTVGPYSTDFHDIASGTNLYYSAKAGYDNTTGWGSFIGTNLLGDLVSYAPTIPPAPTNLTATAGNATVTLAWKASAGATSYNISRGTSAGGESPYRTGVTSTSYTDTAVTNGQTYFYEVTATNVAGTSGFSNEASATPIAPTLSITSGPTATPGRGSAVIAWTTNLPSNSVVQYGTTSKLGSTKSNNSLVTSHSTSLSGLLRQTKYYYQVSSTAGSTTVTSTGSFTAQ